MFEKGKLDTRPVSLPDHLEHLTLAEAPPGTAWAVTKDAIWVAPDRTMYVYLGAELIPIADDDETGEVRVIRFEEGFVIDLTSTGEGISNKFKPTSLAVYLEAEEQDESTIGTEHSTEDFAPIVAIIEDFEALVVLENMFRERYGREVEGRLAPQHAQDEVGTAKKSKGKQKEKAK